MLAILFLVILVFSLIALAALVLIRAANRKIGILFALFTIILAIWITNNFLVDQFTHSLKLTNIFAHADFFSAPLLVYCFWLFAYYFPARSTTNKFWIWFFFAVSIVLSVSVIFSDNIIQNVSILDGGSKVVRGRWGDIYDTALGLIILAGLYEYYKKYRILKGLQLQQIRYLFLGCFLLAIIASAVNLVLPALFYRQAVPAIITRLGLIGVLGFVGFTAYAIVAHRLFDIRVIIKRTVIFAGLSVFVLGTYAAVVFVAATLFGGNDSNALSSQQMIPNLVAALGIALGFEPLRRWLTVRTDKWLFKGEYTPQQVLQELAETLANVVDLGEAMDGMLQIVSKAMRLAKGAVFLIQPAEQEGEYELKQAVTIGFRNPENLKIAPQDDLVTYFVHSKTTAHDHQHAGPVVIGELTRQIEEGVISHQRIARTEAFIERMHNLDGSLALPLYIKRQQPVPTPPGSPPRFHDIETFIGILVLGEKKSGDPFTDQDLELLGIVATQTATAVEKSRLFEEDQLKSEFVAVASHELLTPTAAMEGYLSMILEEGMGKVDDQARGYLETVYSESKRLASLVKDLLNVSRIERGKIVVKAEEMSIDDAITQVFNSLKFRAEERKIKLVHEATKMPKVVADAEKLAEVMVNLIGNAIKYTPEGGQAVVTTEQKNGQVFVHIKDNGIGMKPEDMQHLFTKFFRASNSDQTNQGGTGLGLYITKKIIELMGGTIGVESVVNKGSTFSFSLPIAK